MILAIYVIACLYVTPPDSGVTFERCDRHFDHYTITNNMNEIKTIIRCMDAKLSAVTNWLKENKVALTSIGADCVEEKLDIL